MNSPRARSNMVEGQIRPNNVTDERLIEAISSVNREKFVPKTFSGVAYLDKNIQVAPGRFLMEPMVFSRLLDAAHIKADQLVLDIGCSTGYSSAVLGRLAEAVVALEEDDDLVEQATRILSEEACDNVAVVGGPLKNGLAKQGPYDLIFINGMVGEIPTSLLEQLNDGGQLLCVLEQNGVGKAMLVTYDNKIVGKRVLFDASLPALQAFSKASTFKF